MAFVAQGLSTFSIK